MLGSKGEIIDRQLTIDARTPITVGIDHRSAVHRVAISLFMHVYHGTGYSFASDPELPVDDGSGHGAVDCRRCKTRTDLHDVERPIRHHIR